MTQKRGRPTEAYGGGNLYGVRKADRICPSVCFSRVYVGGGIGDNELITAIWSICMLEFTIRVWFITKNGLRALRSIRRLSAQRFARFAKKNFGSRPRTRSIPLIIAAMVRIIAGRWAVGYGGNGQA